MTTMTNVTRRDALCLGAGAMTVTMLGSLPAGAATNGYREAIAKFAGGKSPKSGRIKLKLPQIAENGGKVPLSVSVESPMTADDHVKQVLVLNDGNPLPGVARFRPSLKSGSAGASMRVRLAGSQSIYVLAEMSDGSVYMAKRYIKVTIGGCG